MTDNTLTSYSDLALIELTLARNNQAAEVLIRRYNQLMFRIARGFTNNTDDAMDIVQEAHLRALQNLSTFRGPTGYAGWLSVITRNVALNRLRSEQRLEYYGDREIPSDQFHQSVSEPVMNQNILQLLENEIDQLPLNYRSVFILRCVQGYLPAKLPTLWGSMSPWLKHDIGERECNCNRKFEFIWKKSRCRSTNLLVTDAIPLPTTF